MRPPAYTYDDGAPDRALFKWGKCQTQSPSFAHGCSSIGLTFHPLTKIQYAQAFNSEGGRGMGELSKVMRKGESWRRRTIKKRYTKKSREFTKKEIKIDERHFQSRFDWTRIE
jgi:hypothetical protein